MWPEINFFNSFFYYQLSKKNQKNYSTILKTLFYNKEIIQKNSCLNELCVLAK